MPSCFPFPFQLTRRFTPKFLGSRTPKGALCRLKPAATKTDSIKGSLGQSLPLE